MPDSLGRITVPTPVYSGSTFPLVTEYPYGNSRDFSIIEHKFQELNGLAVQRYQVGIGPRRFSFSKPLLTYTERNSLRSFYSSMQGSYKSFDYLSPNPDRSTTTSYRVIFDVAPLTIKELANACQTGLTFLECPDSSSSPTYSISDTVVRFPTSAQAAFTSSLLSQVQQFIPLVHLSVRNPSVPDIYLSDRRCTVGGVSYLPRLLGVGEPGSDVLMTQDISGRSDNVSFTFANADRAMSSFIKDAGSLQFADIDFCLYHVNSSVLIQIWKGIVISYVLDASPEFRVQCSDGLYPITQAYPRRSVSSQCWKPFNDGLTCPWALVSGVGNPSSCDYLYNSTNGCLSHGMGIYFGGHPSFPQSVVIKDNGTGILNFGRDSVTSTSIRSNSVEGQPLPEIWCNDDGDPRKAFWANCLVAAVRDESDFEDVLGIVGAGPLGGYEGMSVQTNADGYSFIVAPFADGFPPQGFRVDSHLHVTEYHPELGLREVLGADPAVAATDQFALGEGTPQRWTVNDPVYGQITPYAAGTAFVEVRYNKQTSKGGIVPTTAESHTLSVPIARGLSGYTFDTLGNRSALTPGITNPFWVAVNCLFRCLGIDNADAATQRARFLLSSINKGDGTGAAEISDLVVPAIIGGGTETQYRFQGTLTESKPFRDWLTEILTCALGIFTFEFDKLCLRSRNNATVTSTFTAGNMLYQSFSLTPAPAEFEHLRLSFANRDLQYQLDWAEYTDKDHAAYYGRTGAPLSSQQRSVGLSTLSQALRVCATRVREEIGGILRPDIPANPYIEFDNNNLATWKTTILALETGVGQVVSVTHPDLTTYPGLSANTWKFRIGRWSLHKDYSVSISARSVTDAMYDLTLGPRATDLTPLPLPILNYPVPTGPVWTPYEVQADSADSMFPNEWTFNSDQEYVPLTDTSVAAVCLVTGKLPVTAYAPGVGTPSIGLISQSTTGGSIPGGVTYRITVLAYDTEGRPSPQAVIAIVQVPAGTNTNRIILSSIIWPKVTGLTGYGVFGADSDDRICVQQAFILTPTGSGDTYTPTTLTLSNAFQRSTISLPSVNVRKVRVKGKLEINGGVLGAGVTAVGTNTITSTDLIDGAGTPFDPTGRDLSIIGRLGSPCPFASFLINSFNPSTGVFTLNRDPTGIVAVGDAFTVRTKRSASTTTSVTDPGYQNVTNAYTGLDDTDGGTLSGSLLRVISGTGRGSIRKITGNTHTQIFWSDPIDPPLDATSRWVTEEAGWRFFADSTDVTANSDPLISTTIQLSVDNFQNQPLLLAGYTVDQDGVESPDGPGPIREDWVFGAPGSGAGAAVTEITITTDTTLDPIPQTVLVDTTAGDVTVTLPPMSDFLGLKITIKKITSDGNSAIWTTQGADTVHGVSSGSLDSQWQSVTIEASSA